MCLGGAKEYTVSYFSSAKKICCFRSQVHSDFCNISFVHFHVTLFSRHVMVLPTSPSYLCKLQASLCTLVELTIDSGSRHWLSTGASACILKLTVGSWLTAALALSFSSYVFGITHCCIFKLLAMRDVPCQPSKFQHYSFILTLARRSPPIRPRSQLPISASGRVGWGENDRTIWNDERIPQRHDRLYVREGNGEIWGRIRTGRNETGGLRPYPPMIIFSASGVTVVQQRVVLIDVVEHFFLSAETVQLLLEDLLHLYPRRT